MKKVLRRLCSNHQRRIHRHHQMSIGGQRKTLRSNGRLGNRHGLHGDPKIRRHSNGSDQRLHGNRNRFRPGHTERSHLRDDWLLDRNSFRFHGRRYHHRTRLLHGTAKLLRRNPEPFEHGLLKGRPPGALMIGRAEPRVPGQLLQERQRSAAMETIHLASSLSFCIRQVKIGSRRMPWSYPGNRSFPDPRQGSPRNTQVYAVRRM